MPSTLARSKVRKGEEAAAPARPWNRRAHDPLTTHRQTREKLKKRCISTPYQPRCASLSADSGTTPAAAATRA